MLESRTDTTLTVTAVPGREYSKDGVHWQDENTFTGLEPNTSYDIYVRTKAEENQMEGQSAKSSFTTKHSKPSTPSAPTVQSKSDVKVTLNPSAGLEYSKDGTAWQDSNEFTGLTPDTEYTFYTRVKETDDTMPSDVSQGTTVRTKQASPSLALNDLEVLSKTDTKITVDLPEGYEAKINDDGVYQDSGEFTGLTPDTDYDIIYRLKETESSMASNEHTQVVRTKKSSTTVGAPAAMTLVSKTDIQIVLNVPAGQEVKISGTEDWQDTGTFDNLSPNTEYTFVTRIKETDTAMPGTEGQPLVVKTKKSAPNKPTAPVLVSKTDTTITIQTVPGQEYKLEGAETWETRAEFTGLTQNTEYKIYTRIPETADQMGSLVSDPLIVTTKKDAAHALPEITEQEGPDGNTIVTVPDGTEVDNGDETLPAGEHDITPNHKENLENHRVAAPEIINRTDVSFEIVVTPGFEYEVYQSDTEVKPWTTTSLVDSLTPGTEYKVRARYAETETSMPSNPSDWTVVRTKNSAPSAPSSAPEVIDKTNSTITIKVEPDREYKLLPDGEWTTDGTFEGLDPNTSYEIVSRIPETEDTMPSGNSPTLTVTTKKDGASAPSDELVVIDRTNTSIEVEVPEGYEVRIDGIGDGEFQTEGLFDNLNPDTEYTFIYRVAETDDTMPSAAATQKISTKKDPTPSSETSSLELVDKTDTSVTVKVPSGQEVKITGTGETAWQDSGEFSNLTPNTMYSFDTRVKETEDQEPGEVLSGFTVTTKRDKDHSIDPDEVTSETSEGGSTLTPPKGTEVSIDGGSHWTDEPVDTSGVEDSDIIFRAKQPELVYVTDVALAVEESEVIEYSINDGSSWQDDGTFTGLTADTPYEVVARIKETDSNEASDKSQPLPVRTLKTAPVAPVEDLVVKDRTDTTIEFELIPGYEIKVDNREYQQNGLFENLIPGTEYTFVYRIAQTADTMPSGTRQQVVSTKKSGVTIDDTQALELISKTDTTISLKVPDGQEVKIVGAQSDEWVTTGEFTGLTQNTTYEFITRVKETDDQEPGAELNGFFVTTKRDSWHTFDPDEITDDKNILTPPDGAEVSIDKGNSWTDEPVDVSDVDKDEIIFRPKQPELESKTDTEIVITPNGDVEYSKNPDQWQEDNEFTELTPDTSYEIVTRFPETEESMPSETSEPLVVDTKDTAHNTLEDMTTSTPNTEHPENVDITIPDGLEVSTDGGETWDDEDLTDIPKDSVDTLLFRVMAPQLESATTDSIKLVSLDGLEYAIGDESGYTWQDSALFEGLSEGTKYTFVARLKETNDYMQSDISEPAEHSTKTTPIVIPPKPEQTEHGQYLYGYPGNKVGPDYNLTREEAAALVYRVSGLKATDKTGTFPDVKADRWSIVEVETLAQNGVIVGYEDGTFRPNGKITRAEFITMVVNLFNSSNTSDKVDAKEKKFSDLTNKHWAYDFIQQGVSMSWLSGYEDNTFRADNNITRAEAIVILNRMLGRGNCEYVEDLKNPWTDVDKDDWYYQDIIEATVTHKCDHE